MADTKISALTVATTPLAGTEVLPIVQSGVTKQVSVANLTAGRAVSADSLTLTGSPLPATSGGTGQSSYAVGDLLYASTTTALSKLADVATGNALISGGVGVAPSWGKIGLATHVSGTLGTTNGGTGLTSFTANGIVYASSTSALATSSSLGFDSSNNLLLGTTVNGSSSNSLIVGMNTTLTAPSGVIGRFKGGIQLNSLSTASSGEIDSLYFQKSHTVGINIANYDLAILKSFTSNGYAGGLNIYTGKSVGGGSYAATLAMKIDEVQDVTISAGNLVIGTSGKGITDSTSASSIVPTSIGGYCTGRSFGVGTSSPIDFGSGYGSITVTSPNGTDRGFFCGVAGSTGTTGVAADFRAYNGSQYLASIIMTADGNTAYGAIKTFTNGSGGNTAGPYISTGGTSWTSSSDENLKNITGEISEALQKISQLRAAEFTWKSDKENKPKVGLIAQDVQQVLPEAVVVPPYEIDPATNEPMHLGVNYNDVIPLLVAAIKELNIELANLKGAK